MRKDNRYPRSPYQELTSKLNSGTLSDTQALGVWEFLYRCDDPSAVSQLYRSYRDSNRCTLPRETLRHMRDTMINDMREQNKKDPKPRVQTQRGNNTHTYGDGVMPIRKGS